MTSDDLQGLSVSVEVDKAHPLQYRVVAPFTLRLSALIGGSDDACRDRQSETLVTASPYCASPPSVNPQCPIPPFPLNWQGILASSALYVANSQRPHCGPIGVVGTHLTPYSAWVVFYPDTKTVATDADQCASKGEKCENVVMWCVGGRRPYAKVARLRFPNSLSILNST